jgi:GNAT superfamily N-acetyltransferase
MEIRTFKKSDADQIKDIIIDILDNEFSQEKEIFPPEDLLNLSESYSDPKETILIAEEGARIIGAVSIKKETDDIALINRLFVGKEYRGRKYGQSLIRRAIDFAKVKDYKKILFRSATNMKVALNLCLKNGFTQINEKTLGQMRIVELSLNLNQ